MNSHESSVDHAEPVADIGDEHPAPQLAERDPDRYRRPGLNERMKAAALYFCWVIGVEIAIGAPVGYYMVDLHGPWQVPVLLGAIVLSDVIIERFEPHAVRRLGLRAFGFEYWKPIGR